MSGSSDRSWMSELSPAQKKAVSWGITSLAICAIALLVTLALMLGSKVVRLLSPAISPLVLGLLLSFIFCGFFEKVPRKALGLAYWLFWLVVALGIILALWGWGAKLISSVGELASTMNNAYNSVVTRFPQFKNWLLEVNVSGQVMRGVTFFVNELKNISTWLFAIFFGYCFLKYPNEDRKCSDDKKHEGIVKGILEAARHSPLLPPLSEETWEFFAEQVSYLANVLTKYFPTQLMINIMEGLIGAIGMLIIGLPSGVALGFLMGFMNLIPLVGTFIMLPIVLAVAYFCEGGSLLQVLQALGVWAVVEAVDIFVPPLVHGKEMNLPAGVTVFSFLFWGALIDPIWGMILAIPLTAFALGFFKSMQRLLSKKQWHHADVRQTENKEQAK